MASPLTTRDRLISEGMRQLLAHGYEGVGIGPILKAVNVPKGSFYHFFKSKDDFVVAIIRAYEEKYRAVRARYFSDASLTPLARLDGYLGELERELQEDGAYGGCLYGVIAQTITGRDPAVSHAMTSSFLTWEKSLRELLEAAQAAGQIDLSIDLDDLVATLVEAYEGALIRMKALNDATVFTRFRTKGLARILAIDQNAVK